MAVNPISLANLRLFTTDNQPSPEKKSLGGMIRAALSEMGDWTPERLQAVVDDPASPAFRVIAANRILGATDNGSDFDRVVNTTDGQPIARAQNENTNVRQVKVIRLPTHGDN